MGREKGGVTSELPWGTIMSKGYLVTLTDTSKPTSNFKFKKKDKQFPRINQKRVLSGLHL